MKLLLLWSPSRETVVAAVGPAVEPAAEFLSGNSGGRLWRAGAAEKQVAAELLVLLRPFNDTGWW